MFRNAEEAYKVLGLDMGASNAEVAARYRDLASVTHPDRGGDEFLFHEVKSAYDFISAHRETTPSSERRVTSVASDPVDARIGVGDWLAFVFGLPFLFAQYVAVPFVVLRSLIGNPILAIVATPLAVGTAVAAMRLFRTAYGRLQNRM